MAQVQLPMRGEVHILNVVNISAGGLLLRMENQETSDFVLGAVVQVFLDVPAGPAHPALSLSGDADVVRILPSAGAAPATMALMWSSSDATFARTLAGVLDVAKLAQG